MRINKKVEEYTLVALGLLCLTGIFLFLFRWRLGPLYEDILIDASGLLQQRPWIDFSGKQFHLGLFPLWNPYTGFGQPHLANIQTAVFYPLNAIIYLFGSNLGYEFWILIRLWLGGFFLYLFLRELEHEVIPAFAGSLIWPLGGYGLWFMQLVELNTQILLPVFLILLHNLAWKARWRYFLGMVLIGMLIFMGGHPEAIFNSWAIGTAYYVYRSLHERLSLAGHIDRLILLGVGGAMAVMLAFVVLLPFANYLSRCWSLHYAGFGFYHLDIRTMLSFLTPDHPVAARGQEKIAVDLLGKGSWHVFSTGYLKTTVAGVLPGPGVVVTAIALVDMFRLKRARPDFAFFALVLVFLLGLTYGIAPFRWLAFIPPFNSESNFKFYYSEIYFCIAVLVSIGVGRITTKIVLWYHRLMYWVVLISLLAYSIAINPYLQLNVDSPEGNTWMEFLQKKSLNGVPARIVNLDGFAPALPPNLSLLSGISDVASSDAIFPKDYFNLMDRLNGIGLDQRLNYFYPAYYVRPLRPALESPLMGPYGIKWVLANYDSDRELDTLAKYGYAQRILQVRGVRKIKAVVENMLLEKYSAWPRSFVVKDLSVPLESMFLSEIQPAYVLSYSAQQLKIESKSDDEGWLVLTDLYYPGWQAWVDGKPAKVEKAYGGFRAVKLGAGKHELGFRFEPADFRIGLFATSSSLFLVCMVAVLRRRRRRDAKTA